MSAPDDYFFLARDICEQMLWRLEFMTLKPHQVVNMSQDGGYSLAALKERYPKAEIENDPSMIAIQDHSVDLVFANFYLPWCEDLSQQLQAWRRLLRPEGLLLFSSLGPDTGREIAADYRLPILLDMHDVGDALTKARFMDPVLDVEHLTVTYQTPDAMLNELQAMRMVSSELTKLDEQALYAFSYEIIYGHAFGPSLTVDQTMDETGVVKIPLAHLRRRT